MQRDRAVTISESAASKIKALMTKGDHVNGVRIALVRTHCMGGRGYAYELALEGPPTEDDQVLEDREVKVYMDKSVSHYLFGSTLDYVDSALGQGFVINNPNAISKCPCRHHEIFY